MNIRENEIRIDTIPGTNFEILQHPKLFSYGTDAILLSGFCKLSPGGTLIDIGTGLGILPLRALGLYRSAKIWGIEVQEDVADMARMSMARNGVSDRIEIIHADIVDCYDRFADGSVDAVYSNPPYMKQGGTIRNQTENARISREEGTLTLEEVFRFAGKKLRFRGKLGVVHRPRRLVELLGGAYAYGLTPKRMQLVYGQLGKRANMVLVEYVKGGGEDFVVEAPLVLMDETGEYTKEALAYYGTTD